MTQQAYSSGTISTLFKSRITILSLLKAQGYYVDDYSDFGVNEVQTMYNNKQLDMLVTTKDVRPEKKTYVKYHLAKTLRRDNLNEYIEDLMTDEQAPLTKNDNIIIIMKQELNDTLMKILNEIWEQQGVYIIILSLERLQFNILEHKYVPKHTIMTEAEIKEFMQKYQVTDIKQLPSISRFDPVSQSIGMRPGDICKIERPSRTAINSVYYRYCNTDMIVWARFVPCRARQTTTTDQLTGL